jgi:hypothetical protein
VVLSVRDMTGNFISRHITWKRYTRKGGIQICSLPLNKI